MRSILVVAMVWLAGSGLALAQDPHLGVALRFAPVSDVDLSAGRTVFLGEEVHSRFEFDGRSDVALGGELSYTHPLLPWLSLGGRLTGYTFEWMFGIATRRDIIGSLSLAPQARMPLAASAELYASVALGVAVLRTGRVEPETAVGPDGSRFSDFGLGWHLSPVAGGRFGVDRDFGVFFEVGASIERFSHGVDVIIDGRGTRVPNTTETSIVQLVVNLGACFYLRGS